MKSVKQKIVFFGPIGDFGGRELECGFIAKVLSSRYEVAICSTGNISSASQVFDFKKRLVFFSVNQLIYNKYWIIRILARLSHFKNSFKGMVSSYSSNIIVKRFFEYDIKVQIVLKELVNEYDVIFICAQLSSGWIEKMINLSRREGKIIIFRTTGTIQPNQNYEYLNNVHLFIHHSESNACRLKIKQHNYVTIDQCAFNEKSLLGIPRVNQKVKKFLTLGRLEKEKNIEVVIKAFLKVKTEGDVLYVIGKGSELENLKKLAGKDSSIVFVGFVTNMELHEHFKKAECVIIPFYKFETGPLTGIESIASSRVIISTKAGAMPERLEGLEIFWFENTVESLAQQMQLVKRMDKEEVSLLSKKIKDRYIESYSKNRIAARYLEVLDDITNICE